MNLHLDVPGDILVPDDDGSGCDSRSFLQVWLEKLPS
jgi:hypothetical protein